MRSVRWLVFIVVASVVLQCRYADAQRGKDDDKGGKGDERDSICASTLSDVELRGTLNVTGRCQLIGSDVRGDVLIFAGGSLLARDTRIRGSIEASRADFVELLGARVDQNVSLRELVGDSSRIESSELHGNVVLTSNRSRFDILDNQFGHDLGVFGNTGGLRIAANAIEGDLACSGNVPAPTLLGNRIGGDAEGQCDPRPPPSADPTPSRPATTPVPSSPPSTPQPTGSAPPPSTPAMPAAPATSATPATPEPAPPAATQPAAAAPPSPAPADTPPAELLDDGGAGASGWSMVALLLPLVAWRRRRRASAVSVSFV